MDRSRRTTRSSCPPLWFAVSSVVGLRYERRLSIPQSFISGLVLHLTNNVLNEATVNVST